MAGSEPMRLTELRVRDLGVIADLALVFGPGMTALTAFGAIDLGALAAARQQVRDIDQQLAALGGDARARAREIDLLRFQVDELDAAAIDDPDEDELLAGEGERLAGAAAHREAAA